MSIGLVFYNLDDYILKSKIGGGSFSDIYKAENKKNGEIYAVKIIKASFNSYNLTSFIREASVILQLNYPSIIKSYGINFRSFSKIANNEDIQPSILMKYYPNGSLKNVLEKERNGLSLKGWDPTKKYICLIRIADAMRYLHEHKILHRDLKPENILMDENLEPVIGDFGLSKSADNKSYMTKNIGTPLYMAPELIENDSNNQYGYEVDVYSFSMLAFELVTGKQPFSDLPKRILENEFVFQNKVVDGVRPRCEDDVPDGMKKLLERCWDKNPSERPSFDEIFNILKSDQGRLLSPEDVDDTEIEAYLNKLEELQTTNREKIKEEDNLDHSEVDQRNNELEDQLKEANNKIQALEQQNIDQNKAMNELNSQILQLTRKNLKIEQKNEDLDEKIQFHERKNIELEQKNKELQEKLKNEALKNQSFEKKNKTMNKDAERQIQELNNNNQLLMKKCTELENQLKEAQKKNSEFEKTLGELQNKNQSLEKKCDEKENKLKATQDVLIYFIFDTVSNKNILSNSKMHDFHRITF